MNGEMMEKKEDGEEDSEMTRMQEGGGLTSIRPRRQARRMRRFGKGTISLRSIQVLRS